MKKIEKEIIAIPVAGWDSSYLATTEKDKPNYFDYLSFISLMEEAGVPNTLESTFESFRRFFKFKDGELPSLQQETQEEMKLFREKNKSNFPKLFKIKFTIETEELSDEESDRIWENNMEFEKEQYLKDVEDKDS